MKQVRLDSLSVDELVGRFVELAINDDDAMMEGDVGNIPVANSLFWKMEAVEAELKSRPGDQRRSLMSLFHHQNTNVRLKAAKATLAVAPTEARQEIERIKKSQDYPYAGHAGMCLWALDQGIFKPT